MVLTRAVLSTIVVDELVFSLALGDVFSKEADSGGFGDAFSGEFETVNSLDKSLRFICW